MNSAFGRSSMDRLDRVGSSSHLKHVGETETSQLVGDCRDLFAAGPLDSQPNLDVLQSVHEKSPGDACRETYGAARRLPGARASTARATDFWNSVVRWILVSRCGRLRTFLFSSFRARADDAQSIRTSGPVWPIPLPYTKRDQQAKSFSTTSFQRGVNAVILLLNWLHLGQPGAAPKGFSLRRRLTGEQRGVVSRLERVMQLWADSPEVTAAEMGRTASKVESLEDQISSLATSLAGMCSNYGASSGGGAKICKSSITGADIQVAKPIEADRIRFTGAPTFDPAPYFDETTAAWYNDPLALALPEDEVSPPPVHVSGFRPQILKLLKNLDSTQRLAIHPAEDIPMKFRAGLFSLPKSLEVDRLIMDSRPQNLREEQLGRWTQSMATSTLLTQFELLPSEVLAVSAEDLKDFYFFYRVGNSRCRRNAIKVTLTELEARQYKCFSNTSGSPSGRYIPCLATMAMGDRNAVEYGQQSHIRLGLDNGIFGMTDLLSLRGRIPRDQTFAVGIVIDDLVMLEKLQSGAPPSELSPAIAAADDMVEVYKSVGLKPNDAKRVRRSLKTDFWGSQLDGERGLVAAQPQRTLPVTLITARIARLGYGSKKLLEVLAGAWTAVAQLRKRCMCLLDCIFDEISGHDYGEVFPLSESLIAELWSLAVLAPLMTTDLRARTDAELSMVDASSDWKAEVSVPLPRPFLQELNRHALAKSVWNRILSPWKALQRARGVLDPNDELPDGPLRAHPVWAALAASQKFECKDRRKVRGSKHINLSEMDAFLECEARRGRCSPSSRLHIASDSQVVCGAITKGRSSSKCLNSRLRKALPTLLGFGSYSYIQYVQSHANPADDPTRCREVRQPSIPEPDWLKQALAGDFSSMDDMLAKCDWMILQLLVSQSTLHLGLLPLRSSLIESWSDEPFLLTVLGRGVKLRLQSVHPRSAPSHGCLWITYLTELCICWSVCRRASSFSLETAKTRRRLTEDIWIYFREVGVQLEL